MKMFIVMQRHQGTFKPMLSTLSSSEPMAKRRALGGALGPDYWDSNYVTIPVEIKSTCDTCGGLGYCDDLEPGDIRGKQWVCPTCKGAKL